VRCANRRREEPSLDLNSRATLGEILKESILFQVKRELPTIMLKAQHRIEQWRDSLLKSIHPRLDATIYLLVWATCQRLGNVTRQLMPQHASELEMLTRSQLFGLQFALSGLAGSLAQEPFAERLVPELLSPERVVRACVAVDHMYHYSLVRDIFLAYAWGQYEIMGSTENNLEFVDSPDWRGSRDRAGQIICQEIKGELPGLVDPGSVDSPESILERRVEVPKSLPLDGLTASQFVYVWMRFVSAIFDPWWSGQSPVMENNAVIAMLQEMAGLSADEAERFFSLVTFDRKGSSALTLFHCPLVPLTTSSVVVVPSGFIFENLTACIPRLAVHRGSGFNAYSKEVEAHFLEKLKGHFQTNTVHINTNVQYSWTHDRGDIDFVLYEPANNQVLIAMVKVFIVPDTVEEVFRANRALEEGLQQVSRASRWLASLNFTSWANALKVPLSSSVPRLQFAVIGRGFAGSDCLAIPKDVVVVDSRYLLVPKFAGRSIFEAIDSYQRRLAEVSAQASVDLHRNSVELADIVIEFPSWEVTIS
jgi:hypothetical protein